MCSCHSTGVKIKVLIVQVVPLPLSVMTAKDQQLVTPGDTTEPKFQPCAHLNLAARAFQRQFSCRINDSSSVKTCDCHSKMENCVCEVYQHVGNRRI